MEFTFPIFIINIFKFPGLYRFITYPNCYYNSKPIRTLIPTTNNNFHPPVSRGKKRAEALRVPRKN